MAEVAASPAILPVAVQIGERTRHHIALRLLPFVFILYITSYLDRTSVAYAAIGMARDLGFNDRVFGLGIGIFFLSYVALQIPGALLVERWSARRMISATMIVWGLLTAVTALVHTPVQLYLARFLLGAAEAGFFPGVIVYLSHWFIQEDRAKATSNFMAAIPLSLIIGSPVAGWILGHNWFNVQGWRWLFVLEGVPAIVLGITAFFVLTDWPSEAAWLAPEQKQWSKRTLEEERPQNRQSVKLSQTLRSRTILVLAAAAFLNYFTGYAVIFWLPTILKRKLDFPTCG
jgi:ACS family tartrate transporter-like MFS transporter